MMKVATHDRNWFTMLSTMPLGYHLHVGVHDIYPTLIRDVFAEIPDYFEEHMIDLIPPKKVRSIAGESHVKKEHLIELQQRQNEHRYLRAIISGHGLLCDPSKIATFQGMYGVLSGAFGSLARIFSDVSATIHVSITSQATYGPVIDYAEKSAGPELWKNPEMMSWQPLIKKIRQRFPTSHICVWPIDNPADQAADFLSGLSLLPFDESQRKRIKTLAAKDRSVKLKTLAINEEFSFILENLYEDDLEALERMPNVVIGSRNVK